MITKIYLYLSEVEKDRKVIFNWTKEWDYHPILSWDDNENEMIKVGDIKEGNRLTVILEKNGWCWLIKCLRKVLFFGNGRNSNSVAVRKYRRTVELDLSTV